MGADYSCEAAGLPSGTPGCKSKCIQPPNTSSICQNDRGIPGCKPKDGNQRNCSRYNCDTSNDCTADAWCDKSTNPGLCRQRGNDAPGGGNDVTNAGEWCNHSYSCKFEGQCLDYTCKDPYSPPDQPPPPPPPPPPKDACTKVIDGECPEANRCGRNSDCVASAWCRNNVCRIRGNDSTGNHEDVANAGEWCEHSYSCKGDSNCRDWKCVGRKSACTIVDPSGCSEYKCDSNDYCLADAYCSANNVCRIRGNDSTGKHESQASTGEWCGHSYNCKGDSICSNSTCIKRKSPCTVVDPSGCSEYKCDSNDYCLADAYCSANNVCRIRGNDDTGEHKNVAENGEWCEHDYSCKDGSICRGNTCIAKKSACTTVDATDCAGHECDSNDYCLADAYCSANNVCRIRGNDSTGKHEGQASPGEWCGHSYNCSGTDSTCLDWTCMEKKSACTTVDATDCAGHECEIDSNCLADAYCSANNVCRIRGNDDTGKHEGQASPGEWCGHSYNCSGTDSTCLDWTCMEKKSACTVVDPSGCSGHECEINSNCTDDAYCSGERVCRIRGNDSTGKHEGQASHGEWCGHSYNCSGTDSTCLDWTCMEKKSACTVVDATDCAGHECEINSNCTDDAYCSGERVCRIRGNDSTGKHEGQASPGEWCGHSYNCSGTDSTCLNSTCIEKKPYCTNPDDYKQNCKWEGYGCNDNSNCESNAYCNATALQDWNVCRADGNVVDIPPGQFCDFDKQCERNSDCQNSRCSKKQSICTTPDSHDCDRATTHCNSDYDCTDTAYCNITTGQENACRVDGAQRNVKPGEYCDFDKNCEGEATCINATCVEKHEPCPYPQIDKCPWDTYGCDAQDECKDGAYCKMTSFIRNSCRLTREARDIPDGEYCDYPEQCKSPYCTGNSCTSIEPSDDCSIGNIPGCLRAIKNIIIFIILVIVFWYIGRPLLSLVGKGLKGINKKV